MTELRELIQQAIENEYENSFADRTHDASPEALSVSVLGAIEASGRVTVDRARFERLLLAANMAADEWGADSRVGLEPGDLEPLP